MQNVLFISILIYASIRDIKYKRVDTHIHILLLLTGLCNASLFSLSGFMYAVTGYIALFLPMFIVAYGGNIGGGDVKLSALCGFILGPMNGLIALIVGMFIGVIVRLIINVITKKSNPFALVPYVSIGCIVVLLTSLV